MSLDQNVSPYYNNYDPSKGYYTIMFRPGFPPQARELTQLQSIIQNQVKQFGSSIYQQGSVVIPGGLAVSVSYPYVKLQANYGGNPINVSTLLGKTIVGLTSGAVATVLNTVPVTGGDPNTIYVKYNTGASSQTFTGTTTTSLKTIIGITGVDATTLAIGTTVTGTGFAANTYIVSIQSSSAVTLNNAIVTGGTRTVTATTSNLFSNNETIQTIETSPIDVSSATSAATGLGSSVSIQAGVYFVNGYFVYVDDQTLILDKYTATPSYNIGLLINDSFVSASDDPSLYSLAAGFPNFNGPGADRYKIVLDLIAYALNATPSVDFIQLTQVKDGIIQNSSNTAKYSEIGKTLARRTYDESGDYTVRYNKLQIKESLLNGSNGGVYTTSEGGEESEAVLFVGPGKAYIKGFEVENLATTLITIPKARDTYTNTNYITYFSDGNYVLVDNLKGSFDITNNISVNLRSATAYGGSTIGTANVKGQELVTGTPGSATYALYLYNIVMSGGNQFSAVKSIGPSSSIVADTILDSAGHAELVNSSQGSNLVLLPEYAINTVSNVTYSVRRAYMNQVMSGTTLTLTAGTNEVYEAGNVLTYQVSIVSASGTATGNGYVNGNQVNMQSGANTIVIGGSPTGRQVTLTIPLISGSTIDVIATVTKTAPAYKTKTAHTSTSTTVAYASTITLVADVYQIVSITDVTTSKDITNQFTLNDGETNNFYNRATLTFNTAYPAPVGNVTIVYDYFSHGSGDYFSVSSYNGVVNYEDVQAYISGDGTIYPLVNVLDFRSRENDAGSGFSVLSEIPIPNSEIELNYSAYLPKMGLLVEDNTGTFNAIFGSSSNNPAPPPIPSNSIALYNLYVPPYTFSASDIIFTLVNNQRYTMADIGKLVTRITNLEYYTTLSMLETQTANYTITDGSNNDMFKNGLAVDNFSTYSVASLTNPDFKASIDTVNGICRPPFLKDNVGFVFESGSSSHFQLTGNLLTLPYTTTSFLYQGIASTTSNINPYNVYVWNGSLSLNPSSDDWFNTTQAPDIIVTNDSSYNASLAAENGNVIWNDWQTTWVGTPVITTTNSSTTGAQLSTSGVGIAADNQWSAKYGSAPTSYVFVLHEGFVPTYTQISSTTTDQSRTGIQTNITSSTTNQVVNSSIVNQSVIPYMRANAIAYTAKAMKPNTQLYAFFGNVNVSSYCSGTHCLLTDSSGSVSGTFNLPDPSTGVEFQTGAIVFTLTDDANNSTSADSVSQATYTAAGVLDTVQNTIESTVTQEVSYTEISQTQTLVNSTSKTFQGTPYYFDPIAQAFQINSPGGIFLSKIDIYFSSKDAGGVPVRLQIRNMVNGYPGQVIVPFSDTVIKPSDITTSTDSSVATSFTFSSPVYLNDQTEYCLVLISNSNAYNVYVAELGQADIITGVPIAQIPYLGSMFASQNASTWLAQPDMNIKFNLWQCVFNTSSSATLVFNNDVLDSHNLSLDALTSTNTSGVVNIFDEGHGLATGQTTTISGAVVSGNYNGLSYTELNGTHSITLVDQDNYTITLTTHATKTGLCGGTGLIATRNCIVDLINVNIQNMTLPETTLSVTGYTTVSGVGETISGTPTSIALGRNLSFLSPQIVYSTENEESGGPSLVLHASLGSTNSNISPVIDITRISSILVTNRINEEFDSEGDVLGEEAATGGSALAKYISASISLDTSATSVITYVSCLRPATADIQVFVKSLPANVSASLFNAQPWVRVPTTNYPTADGANFHDYTFQIYNLVPFNNFAIKIVMISTDESLVPQLQNLRMVATS